MRKSIGKKYKTEARATAKAKEKVKTVVRAGARLKGRDRD